ncbi:outer membrane beta-barrel protein [Lacibacter luteus]|nr:outer membrane beta-barrel protein [Lacibacter luteus]
MEDNQFEQKIGQEMAGFKLKPSDAVWQNVDAQLKEDRKRRRWVLFFLFAGLLLGGAGLFYIISGDGESKPTATHQTTINNTTVNKENKEADSKSTITLNEQQQENKAITNTATGTKIASLNEAEPQSINKQQQRPAAIVSVKGKDKKVTVTKSSIKLPVAKDQQQSKQFPAKEEVAIVSTEKKDEGAVVDTTTVVNTKSETTTSATIDHTVQTNADSVSTTAGMTPADSSTKTKNKWRVGLHVNTGIAQIRESVFPGVMSSSADASPLFGNNGGSGGPTSITVNQFTVKPALQFGAGVVVRKTILKKHAFVTGLQYQYSSYKVEQTQRVDSFYQTTNSFSTVMKTESSALFKTHSIAIPLEIEWKIASTSGGVFRLGTGLQQWFTLSSAKKGTVASAYRYSGTSLVAGRTATAKATTWQPVLQLAPLYEWSTKKQTSQLGLFFNYGLRPVYKTTASDYWWQTGVRYRFYFTK